MAWPHVPRISNLSRLGGQIDWDRAPERLRNGDLSELEEAIARPIRDAAACDEVEALARHLGISPVALVIGLIARAQKPQAIERLHGSPRPFCPTRETRNWRSSGCWGSVRRRTRASDEINHARRQMVDLARIGVVVCGEPARERRQARTLPHDLKIARHDWTGALCVQ